MTHHKTPRRKVWLTREHLTLVNNMIINRLDIDKNPCLQAIHDEIAVASQRYSASTSSPAALSVALGRNKDDVPISLSVEEASYIMTFLHPLPVELRDALLEVA